MSDRLSITVIENGPIQVSHASRVRFCGEPVDVDGDVWLCRCGKSANAPFCDGSHRKVGFTGDNELENLKEIRVWEGRTVRTRFNPNTCMHVFKCKPLKALREAELAGDDAAATEIMRVVRSCPSGALSYEVKEARSEPSVDFETEIDIQEGGEIRVQKPFDINYALNESQPGDRATLCRCGLSKNKPWCDGRHVKAKDFR